MTFYLFRQYENTKNDDYFYYNTEIKRNYYPNDVEHKIILKLIDIRFKLSEYKNKNDNEINYKIISENDDNLKIFLIKILWMESNYDYIINIIKIYNKLSSLEPKNEKDILFNDIEKYIKNGIVKYIAQEKRNPEHTKEVNEYFYIMLASICQCITNEDLLNKLVSDEFPNFIENCQNSLDIITKLSDELLLFLNERYIIEEFLLIIEGINKMNLNDKDFSINILMKLKSLSNIIQSEEDNKIKLLIESFLDINEYIIKELDINKMNNEENENNELNKNDVESYDLLVRFYLKEYKRLIDINYRTTILEQVLNNDEIIKKSLELFKLILKNILQPEIDKFEKILDKFDNKTDDIYEMIEKKDSVILDDTLLYLFEKHIFIYFEKAELIEDKVIKKKKFPTYSGTGKTRDIIIDKEPIDIFAKCLTYLYNINNPKNKTKNKKMKKLFCIAFIRIYIYKLIYTINEGEVANINDVIEKINKNSGNNQENKIRFIIKNYLYKIIYNIYGRDMSKMKRDNIITKYYLEKLDNNYKNFIDKDKSNVFLHQFLLPKEKDDIKIFKNIFLKIKSYQDNKYNNVDINSIKKDLNDYGSDILFMIFSNLTTNNLIELYDNSDSEIQYNFWKNILDKLFKKEIKLLLKNIFNVNEFKKLLNNNNISKKHLEMLLYSIRFCFKTISSSNNECLYKKILLGDNNCIKDSFLIGNDISENNYYDIYLSLKEK